MKNINSIINIAKKSGILVMVSGVDISSEFIQMYLFSKLGINSLTASSLIYAIEKFALDPVTTLVSQNSVFISQQYGKLKLAASEATTNHLNTTPDYQVIEKDIGNIVRQGWYLSTITSIPSMIILFSIEPILNSIGIASDISAVVSQYYLPVAFITPALTALSINEGFFPAVDQEKWLPLYRVLMDGLSIGLNIFLIPRLGARGAGLTLLLQTLFGLGFTTSLMMFKSNFRPYQILNFSHYPHNYIKKMFIQGLPNTTSFLALTGTNFFLSILLGRMGKLFLGIEQVVVQFCEIATTLSHGINEASNKLVAQALGQRDYKLMRLYGSIGLISSSALYLSITLVYNLIPLKLASLFMPESDIASAEDNIRYTFLLISLAKLFEVIQDSTSLNLAAMEDTFFSSFVSLATTLALILPLSLISVYLTNLNIYGVSGAINIGLFVAAGLTAKYWFKQSNTLSNAEDNDINTETSNTKFASLIFTIPFFKKCRDPETEKLLAGPSSILKNDQPTYSINHSSLP